MTTPELTKKEKEVISCLVQAWNSMVSLPVEHADDMQEIRFHIHALQEKILARPMRRLRNNEKIIANFSLEVADEKAKNNN